MMNSRSALLSLITFVITSCVIPVEPGRPAQLPDRFPVGPAQGRVSAEASQGAMIIRRNGQVLCSFRTALPNVETWRLTRGDSQIIVKSRGNHGPAMVELFDTTTGMLQDKVMASAILRSGAIWAYGFED